MKLSNNFSLAEMIKSQTALRKGINNTPEQDEIDKLRALCENDLELVAAHSHIEIDKLRALCENVLQPVRDHFGKPVTVNSGFRCLQLNRAIGSKDTSQHRKGEAADIEIAGVPNKELAEWIRDNLEFDQLILEFYSDDDPAAGWVHVSYIEQGRRKQCLTIGKSGTSVGLG